MDRDAAATHWADEFVDDRFSRKFDKRDYEVPSELLNLKSVYAPEDINIESLLVVLAEIKDQATKLQKNLFELPEVEGWLERRESEALSRPELRLVGSSTDVSPPLDVGGPDRNEVRRGLPLKAIRRLVELALTEATHNDARRLLRLWLSTLESTPGLLNKNLFDDKKLQLAAAHWPEPSEDDKDLLSLRNKYLFSRLGFDLKDHEEAYVLSVNGEPCTIAVFCEMEEGIRIESSRFNDQTPKEYAIRLAETEQFQHIKWVVLTRSSDIWLYPVNSVNGKYGIGGQPCRSTSISLNLSLLDDSTYLKLLLSPASLKSEGQLDNLGQESTEFAIQLGTRLRERIYEETVPKLADAVASRICSSSSDLAEAYEQVMVILFRLLFVAYGEHTKRLPVDNLQYHKNSLKQLTKELLEPPDDSESDDSESTQLWDRVTELWRAINEGQPDWGIPRYNGGLFSPDPEVSPVGAALAGIKISDAEFRPALLAMLTDEPANDANKPSSSRVIVDFRSLSPREFGTIYEGLLESSLVMAHTDLKIEKYKGQKREVPAGDGDPVDIPDGTVYLQHRSGVRKSTGSYFTPTFAVEHLLNEALEPALTAHIDRLDELHQSGDETKLAEAFFDFRCADIAMGSGHFLTAALDRIEACLSKWRATHPVPGVTAELDRLRQVAEKELADTGTGIEIEDSDLLRRLVARRCIYGVDVNPVAVELARLAMWIHTFIPGLPLSFLDHNLVCGDSLTGVGTLDEAVAAFDPDAEPDAPSLFRSQLEELLAAAESALRRLARTSDATKREIDEARTAHHDAQRAVAGARALFDLITAQRAGVCSLPELFDESVFIAQAARPGVAAAVESLTPLHFPAAFPEVFLRERPGFDCLLGNPPWEKVMVELKVWWGRHIPGVRSQNEREMNDAINEMRRSRPDLEALYQSDIDRNNRTRAVLMAGPYPGIGRSHPDLYKAFAWRNWRLARSETGHVGIVLPRTAFADHGMAAWRQDMLQRASLHLTTLRNKGHWVFDDVHQQYQIALVSIQNPSSQVRALALLGPFHDLDHYKTGMALPPQQIPVDEFITWTPNADVPMLPSDQALRVFRKMRQHPRFDGSTTGSSQQDKLNSLGNTPKHAETRRNTPKHADSVCCRSSTRRRTRICSAAGSTPMAVPSHPGLRRQLGQAPLRPRRRGGGDEARQRLLAGVHGQVVQSVGSRHRGVLVVG